MTRSVISSGVAYRALSLCGRLEESLDICFHDRLSFYDADHYNDGRGAGAATR
jgi:hypothetical protein